MNWPSGTLTGTFSVIAPLARSAANAEDNHRRILATQARERNCQYWKDWGVDHPYDLVAVARNTAEYCR
jgi:hypothetical protein